ncbi:hypothetical protein [Paracoccus sp. (in: a-proteobacteria)]|uniref:hypothetical protein n=1 Tax=Paracoccus sp. TaxID=267 RepID=UPI0032205455
MPLEPARHGREAELAAIGAFGAQVEPGDPEPARDNVLGAMACIEDPQDARFELLSLVLGDSEIVELDLAQTGAPEPRGTDIGAGALGAISRRQGAIDRGRDGGGDRRSRCVLAIEATRAMVQVDHWSRSQNPPACAMQVSL